MRASRALIAGTAVSLAVLVAIPLVVAHVAGAAGVRGLGPRAAIVAVDGDGAVATLPDGSARAAVPWLLPGDADLAFSPSGRRLAFSSARAGNRELYVADVATGAVERITWTRGREDVEPAWSPDGTRLVWASGTESNHDLHTLRIGSNRVRRLTRGPADDREPAWSPNGRTVAYASDEQGAFDLWSVAPGGSGRALLVDAPGDARAPDWHPSGKRLAYTGLVGGAADVWSARLDGTTERLVASRGYDGRADWSPDGSRLGFLRGRDGTLYPWSSRADGTGAAALAPRRSAQQIIWARLDAELAPARSARLPDLDQRTPRDLVVRAAGSRRFVLGFTSATDNLGLGPLWLRARRPTRNDPMLVEQRVHHEGGATVRLPDVGVLRYERHPPHRHWHLDDFVRYDLRSLDGRVAARDRKSGFCLVDRWGFARRVRGIEPALPRFVGDCATLQPGALRVEQGSSVGYTDRYPAFFHGQDLELTGLPAGRYLLVQTANPERRLLELDYANNAASVLLRLSWPSGRTSPPRVQVLRGCSGSSFCGPPA